MRTISVYHRTSIFIFFFSSRRRHTRSLRDWSSDVCSSDLRVVTDPWHLCRNRLLGKFPGLPQFVGTAFVFGLDLALPLFELGFGLGEIGRASCRERV